MSTVNCDIRIGTSGWYYNHWAGKFYPLDLPKTKWLQYYTKAFDTVEINNTFYQLPKQQSVTNWHKLAPTPFLFAVKAYRYITHTKGLTDVADSLEDFFKTIYILKENLGPILYQLPPNLYKDLDLLESFLKLLPKNTDGVFEFRHQSWFSEDTYSLLRKFNIGFCIHDMPSRQAPSQVTADIIYIRFHGPTGRYEGNYTKPQLEDWSQWIQEHTAHARVIYVYFNNDVNAYAIKNAKQLRKLLRV